MRVFHLAISALLSFWLFSVSFAPQTAWADASDSASTVRLTENALDLSKLRQTLDALPTTAEGNEKARRLVSELNQIVQQTQTYIASRTTQLNDINTRLTELGEAPAKGASEAPDITERRATLTSERNTLDADIRLARLLLIDAQQRTTDIRGQQRALFEARYSERSASPLSRTFWRDLRLAWAVDLQRLQPLKAELQTAWQQTLQGGHALPLLVTLGMALALVIVGVPLAERGLLSLVQRLLPPGRLRRSLLIVASVVLCLVIVAIALSLVQQQLESRRLLGPLLQKLMHSAHDAMLFFAYVISLGRALLANHRPSWRLPRLPHPLAKKLAPFTWLTALACALVWLPTEINSLIDASFAAVLATHAFSALLLVLLMAALLHCVRMNTGSPSADTGDTDPPPSEDDRPLWIALTLGIVSLALVLVLVLVATGFLALASLIAGQLVWSGVMGASFYVLFKGADDLFMSIFSARSTLGQRLQASFGFAPTTLNQSAIMLSALARLILFFYLIMSLLEPLGTGPGEVFERSNQFGTGFTIGEFKIVPAALIGAIFVLLAGFVCLRVFKRWLKDTYLPSTAMEPGMQASVGTLLGYVGAVVVVAMALSALGLGINRIAWIASALSVGIGFGLQAIVQNFISGLILLAERPVKVGDWVVLGTAEGDIKRISVRTTEIQMGDRSTVIVPNSELITKTVRNMTLTNAEGRVLLKLPMPLSTDAHLVRELILASCADNPDVLTTPAPSVSLEGIENGMLIFQVIAYVNSPRAAGRARSDLLFAMLDKFRKEGVAMASPTTLVMDGPQKPELA